MYKGHDHYRNKTNALRKQCQTMYNRVNQSIFPTNCLYVSIAFVSSSLISRFSKIITRYVVDNFMISMMMSLHGSTFRIYWHFVLRIHGSCQLLKCWSNIPDSKVHGANMGPTWALSAPDRPHAGPMNLAIRDVYINALNLAIIVPRDSFTITVYLELGHG